MTGQVITFYSFKGGVGRTMALANIAYLLAQWGKRVLVVDWDLEAPGLEHYFRDFVDPAIIANRSGVLDLLSDARSLGPDTAIENWGLAPLQIEIGNSTGALELLGSGRRDESYFSRLRDLDVDSLYTQSGGGLMLEHVRTLWTERYDYVLLDSRTGITDIGGICTIHLPDVLVLFFTATEQSLRGAIDVAHRANDQRQRLPVDRLSLNCLPIPSRFDTLTEHKIAQDWLDRFAEYLQPFFSEWLPTTTDTRKFLETTKIPYVSYFSFGERLAVFEQGTTDPTGLGYAYESAAALLGNNLAYADQLIENRDRYVKSAADSRRRPKVATNKTSEVALLLVELDRSAFVGDRFSPSQQDAWFREIGHIVMAVAQNYPHEFPGERISVADDEPYIFQFRDGTTAVRCALAIQERLAVNPIKMEGEVSRTRMGLHAVRAEVGSSHFDLRQMLRATAAIARNAKTGQLIVSESALHSLTNIDGVRFQPAGYVETGDIEEEINVFETYEAIGFKHIVLNRREIELLFEQDPRSRNAGGFQNFLIKLQEKTNRTTGDLELTISDLERIARLAFDYRQGGWQKQLRRIFGRVLGETLGRNA